MGDMLFLIAAVSLAAPSVPGEYYQFLKKPDSSAKWKVVASERGQTEIDLTSQTWQGIVWKHGILVQQPPKVDYKGTAVLYITGDGPRDGDRAQIRLLSGATGMPVAMLFDVPNQPIWDMREDDLIAHTFEKYLSTKDPSWPLLFPMAKSAIRAMDAVVDATKNSENPIKRFVVTGASKRGWTTWFVGASGDKRVAAIAPMVIDNLNVPTQMKHQIESWGEYSPMIQDYTRRGLQQKMETPAGQVLARMVDPYSYRERIKVPTMIVNGGNDQYWTVDALSQYWKDLKQPKWARIVPNVGHDLGGGISAIETIGMFARSVAGAFKMPNVAWKTARRGDSVTLQLTATGAELEKVTVWVVESDNLKFADQKWLPKVVLDGRQFGAQKGLVRLDLGKGKRSAMFAEFRFKVGTRMFSLSTPAAVFK